MLYKRINQGRPENPQWVDVAYQIMITYDIKTVHSSIKMTPNEATKPSNAIDVNYNIQVQATFTRKYPDLGIGSSVIFVERRHYDKRNGVLVLVKLVIQ
jgi:hypothetical protein